MKICLKNSELFHLNSWQSTREVHEVKTRIVVKLRSRRSSGVRIKMRIVSFGFWAETLRTLLIVWHQYNSDVPSVNCNRSEHELEPFRGAKRNRNVELPCLRSSLVMAALADCAPAHLKS